MTTHYPHPQANYRFIVIGNPIAHSQSPSLHQTFAHQTGLSIAYHRQYCPDDAASFYSVVQAFFYGGGTGANVTVPFKQVAYQLCSEQGDVSRHAKVAKAVNTLMVKDGKLYGDNTDGQGLINHLNQLGWVLTEAKVAIIGAGGATRGVILPLIESGISQLTVANRTVAKAHSLIDELQHTDKRIDSLKPKACAIEALTGQYDLIINATSTGLSGDKLPLSDRLTCRHAYDMMYGRQLPFLTHFGALGARVSDGYGMLIGQAALSFALWTGNPVDTSDMLS